MKIDLVARIYERKAARRGARVDAATASGSGGGGGGLKNLLSRIPDELEMEHRYIASTQRVVEYE